MHFGLVGAGCIGQLRAQALAQLEGSALTAVFDVDAGAARALADAHGAAACEDYDALLDRDDVDAVLVSTPPPFHEEQVLAALEKGKHVLCEKPLSNSVASARRMVERAEQAGRALATGFNHRYFPAIQFVKDTLDSGLIGELDHVRAFAGHTGLSEFRSDWEHDKEVMGGGALMDVGIHLIDLTRHLLGEVEEVYGAATSRVWEMDGAEDNGLALLRSPAGKHATLQATWTEWKGYRFHVDVYGTRGMARAYYAPMFSMRVTMDEPGGETNRKYNLHLKNLVQEKLKGWQWTVDRTFRRELSDFTQRCRGGTGGRSADGVAGLRAVEIADAVYRCTEQRRPIHLAGLEKSTAL